MNIVTLPRTPEQAADLQKLAARIAQSPQLHSSAKLCEFLEYVVDCALRDAPEEATEQQIGVHVFHRHPGYSSGDDSIVRSQARLLRAKLNAYFVAEGASEPIVLEIPKGQYLPVFRAANLVRDVPPVGLSPHSPPLPTNGLDVQTEATGAPPVGSSRKKQVISIWSFAAFVLGALLAGLGGYMLRGRLEHPPTPALDAFWTPFYGTSNSLVIFSNPAFTGRPATGLKLLPSTPANSEGADSSPAIDQTYTGTGEASAIHTLTELFDSHQSTFILKRSRLITWDDARDRSLIFVGAPSQNSALNDLPALTQFHIALTPDGYGYVVNDHPRAGEPLRFPVQSATEETAIVALLPGFQPETRIAIFSGLSTLGTEEAVQYFSHMETMREFMKQANSMKGPIRPFEAVLKVRVNKGVVMGATLLAVHSR